VNPEHLTNRSDDASSLVDHLTRRDFVACAAAGTAALFGRGEVPGGTSTGLSEGTGAGTVPPVPHGGESYAFTLGGRRCIAVLDGTHQYQAQRYFVNAPPEAMTRALARHRVPAADRIPSPFTCLAVADDAGGWTLIDTGLGGLSPAAGRLHLNLVAAGIPPASVSTVVLTHAHPDHIGGIVDGGGGLRYPNARFVMRAAEWAFWTSDAGLARVDPLFATTARRQLTPIRDRLTTVVSETEVAPDVTLAPAVGHTPGHAVAIVHPAREQLHFISDAVLHPIHLEEPDWETDYDMDPVQAAAAKRAVFGRASGERALVLAFHFDPFPSLGRVERRGRGWVWEPERV
jgi:glyoxylase-like metal-dependent hydrolase (beta-lactamase superfamily II)